MYINNNMQSPNFGMALKIKPEAVTTLKRCSRETIETLQKVGEELKDTKFCHLEIGDKNRIITTKHNSYIGDSVKFEKFDDNRYLDFRAIWAGTDKGDLKQGNTCRGWITFENAKAAEDAYKDINSSYGIERDAKIVKYIDQELVRTDAEIEAVRKEREAVSGMVDKLFETFGTK